MIHLPDTSQLREDRGEIIRRALELAFEKPLRSESSTEIHYPFFFTTTTFRSTYAMLRSLHFEDSIVVLNTLSSYLSDETIVLLYEDLMNGCSLQALQEEKIYECQLVRVQNSVIRRIIGDMRCHCSQNIAPTFVSLVLRASTEERIAYFIRRDGGTDQRERKDLISIRDQLLSEALMEFKGAEQGEEIADAILGCVAGLERDPEMDKIRLFFVRNAYAGEGAQALIRAVFEDGDEDSQLAAIRNIGMAAELYTIQGR